MENIHLCYNTLIMDHATSVEFYLKADVNSVEQITIVSNGTFKAIKSNNSIWKLYKVLSQSLDEIL